MFLINADAVIRQLRQRWHRKAFDPDFYLDHYEDLHSLRTHKRARKHYKLYGKAEGRFPNLAAFLEAQAADFRAGFDPVAYRHYNKDVAAQFSTADRLFSHYVRYGHKEGRICRFPGGDLSAASLPSDEKWKSLFSPVEFIAWCGHNLKEHPQSRAAALEIFEAVGIAELWPVNLEYRFDAEFVRLNRLLSCPNSTDDAALYRTWLTKGFPAGVAPNETLFLTPYLAGTPFPPSFDWENFVRCARLSPHTTRSQALAALFNRPARKILQTIDLLGADAAWLLHRIANHSLISGKPTKAMILLERAIALEPTAERLHLLGDILRRSGKIKDALDAYTAASDLADAPLAAPLEAATIHAKRREFPAAFEMLRKARHIARGRDAFGEKLDEVIQLYFDHQSSKAHALYRDAAAQDFRADLRRDADLLLAATLEHIQSAYLEMATLPAATGGKPDGYVTILANDGLRQCTHYRIEQKVLQFERAGIPVRIYTHSDVAGFLDSLIGARAAIFYRVAATPPVLKSILQANAMGLATYYEIDDLIFDPLNYPDPFEAFEGQISVTEYTGLQFGVPLFRHALKACQSFIASTPALADHMRPLASTGAGIVVRNGLDPRNAEAIAMGAHPIRSEGSKVRVFYGSGTKAHNADFNTLVGPALLSLMRSNPCVELVIVGHLKLMPEFHEMKARIRTYPFISDITTYWSILASCDINIAVLESGVMADCKSEIKWLEAAVLQVPSIVSGTHTYREVIEPDVDGIVAETSMQWAAALDRLVADPRLRRAIGLNAREQALLHYDLQVGADALIAEFAPPEDKSIEPVNRRLRVLICNVFFAPQSFGGATRVVEDNIDAFTAQYPDLEIAVFCSNEGASEPGKLKLEAQKGIAVYRLSVPAHPDMEWTPFDPANAAPFARVIDHFQPDVIHFHCIQRLTASIVEVARQRGIPYVVTLHDAWWISDNQFLIDRDGLHKPDTDVLNECTNGRDPLVSLSRRQRLAALLNHAHACLSVSAAFSLVYEKAGITNLRVIENGTALQKAIGRQGIKATGTRVEGRVALGHLGTRALHKGAILVEAALRRSSYRNLHLTLVDNALKPGQSIDTIWGTTPVTIIAPVPQSHVKQLYARLNVLLAPSLWPESFGLVTREAIQSGLWVVASNLGAIGNDVEEGRNGHLIDVTDASDLIAVLSSIDENPDLYMTSPPSLISTLRNATDQAGQLYATYNEAHGTAPTYKDSAELG
jgi:glycosyltransferase involved in cell wall biosynthesis/tetratricopeptide (TPR) repeat protein